MERRVWEGVDGVDAAGGCCSEGLEWDGMFAQ